MTSHKRPQQRFGVIGPVLASLSALVLIAGIGWFVLDRTANVLTSQDEPLSTLTDSSTTPSLPVTPSSTPPRRTTTSPKATPTPTPTKKTSSPTPTPRRSTTAPSRDGTRTPKPSPKPTRSTTPTATKTTTSAPSSGTPEAQVLKLTNDERAKGGCGALRMNSALTKAAEAHAADMVDRHYFAHDSLDGRSPFDRMKAAGYTGGAMAENIAVGYQSPAAVVEGWMNSAGHRKNILNCTYTVIGIGYDAGQVKPDWGNGSWVQDFGG